MCLTSSTSVTLKTSHFCCGAKRTSAILQVAITFTLMTKQKQNIDVAFPHQRLAYLRTSDYDFFNSSKGEIYAHIYFCRSDLQPNPNSQNFDQLRIYKRYELTNFREKHLESPRINLFESLMGREPEHANYKPNKNGSDTNIQVARRYWKPSISIHLVTNVPPFSRKDIPQYLRQRGYFFDRNGNLFLLCILTNFGSNLMI